MKHETAWLRNEAEARVRELFDAAKSTGPQEVRDTDGTFSITFIPVKGTLEELFSKPGPIPDDE
ncbi:hypothetical protein [Rhizobium sp. GCM10022189]|uniref:hypothetical protein n=1 Tax=Rhizobium sp. GCM10022189 TaxID=3252654 RepID=UPI00360C96CF